MIWHIALKMRKVKIIKLELGPFGTNAYIVVCKATGESILVDAPAEQTKY